MGAQVSGREIILFTSSRVTKGKKATKAIYFLKTNMPTTRSEARRYIVGINGVLFALLTAALFLILSGRKKSIERM